MVLHFCSCSQGGALSYKACCLHLEGVHLLLIGVMDEPWSTAACNLMDNVSRPAVYPPELQHGCKHAILQEAGCHLHAQEKSSAAPAQQVLSEPTMQQHQLLLLDHPTERQQPLLPFTKMLLASIMLPLSYETSSAASIG